MSAAAILAPAPTEADRLLSELRIAADYVGCVNCRSADVRACQSAPAPCCDDCHHPMDAAQVVAKVRAVEDALAKAAEQTGDLR
ncbi:hypothetical protein [Micromonospora chalcea]|uniref:hypothetical protein n=1 Tax=Micromonospora chalcea TaxID=1874 RepID=UPI003D7369FE